MEKLDPKPCEICGTMFIPRATNSRYCSDSCRKVGKRKRNYINSLRRSKDLKLLVATRRTRKKRIPTMPDIVTIDKCASELGLSYGQYVSRYGV